MRRKQPAARIRAAGCEGTALSGKDVPGYVWIGGKPSQDVPVSRIDGYDNQPGRREIERGDQAAVNRDKNRRKCAGEVIDCMPEKVLFPNSVRIFA